jgi:hypothetical protein
MFHSAHPYLHFLRLWLTVLALLVAWPAQAVSTFTDHSDGTVTDSATSLMWDKCSWGQSDNTCATGSASTHTWAAALGIAVSANTANYKGHNDWRLPNRLELESLVDINSTSAPTIAPAFPNTQTSYYRSSTLYKPDPSKAWTVNFNTAFSTYSFNTANYRVRLVRSGQSLDTFDALAPTVSAISPSSGSTAGGTSVAMSGTHFTGATAVTIDGVAVSSFTVDNDTTITASTPVGTVGAKDIVVTTPEGIATGSGLFTYFPPTPALSAISPTSGSTAGGTAVTLTGTNLTGASAVTIGGAACASVSVVSATSITCTTPAGTAGTASVLVTTSGGTNAANTLYTYVTPPPAPTVTAINPTSGSTLGSTAVTLTGSNLTGASAVTIGGATCAVVTVVSATSLTCTTPARTAGTASVLVTTSGGTNAANTLYTYVTPPPAPTVTAINPTSGSTLGGSAVTITGTDLTGASAVTIGGSACTAVSVVSVTSITCTTPALAAGTASVLVTTSGGINADNDLFLYAPPSFIVKLNDSGVTQCTNNGSTLVACAAANTGNAAAYPRQDARFGRDAAQAEGNLLPAKTGGGAAGFDFTPLDASGNAIALTGTPPVPSATPTCIHDNVTNLTWEVKTTSGLRSNAHTYTWYNGRTGNLGSNSSCGGTLSAYADQCNTYNYALAVNAAGLCGAHSPWRVPTRRELLSLVHHGIASSSFPSIDLDYFPNTDSNEFWASDVNAFNPNDAWYINFHDGGTGADGQNSNFHVRLVRSGQ